MTTRRPRRGPRRRWRRPLPASPLKAGSPPTTVRYEYLLALYGRLDAYNADVALMATQFNENFLSWDTTMAHAEQVSVSTLRGTVLYEADELTALGIPGDSVFYGCAQEMATLLNDLAMRLNPIYDAWSIRQQYYAPADHVDEICAPFSQDVDENGVNVYKKDYDARYPGANPYHAAFPSEGEPVVEGDDAAGWLADMLTSQLGV